MMERRDKYDRNIKIGEKWETCLHFLWLVIIPEKRIIHIYEQICKSENTWNTIWLGLILTSCRGSWQRKGRRWRGRRKSQGRNQGPSAATSQIDEDIDDWEGVTRMPTRTHKRSQQRGVNEEEQRWDSDEDDGEGRLLKRGCLERGVG